LERALVDRVDVAVPEDPAADRRQSRWRDPTM
jgi:hypothetical protein